MNTSSTVRFILDGQIVELEDFDPTRSLLQYLREDLHRCGTKEGCAEGDCGACTVVIGEAVDNRLQLRSINACLLLLPMLHGKLLITVESLQAGLSELHPVQQAMVDCHASQCGFCTPGFVMSLFALYKNQQHPDRDQINDNLSGNLCRCTGYRPIIEAAERMYQLPAGEGPAWLYREQQATAEQGLLEQLQRIKPEHSLAIDHAGTRFFAPTTIAELAELKQQYPEATLLAGNTDVGLWMYKQLRQLPVIIYLGLLQALHGIDDSGSEIRIGAMVSLSDAFASMADYFPALGDLIRQFASLPIRNAGTLGGNVANGSPIGDSMPALLTLDTRVLLNGAGGQRELALEDFYLGYQQQDMATDEWVEALLIPKPADDMLLAGYKVSKRFDQDISAVCASFGLLLDSDQRINHVRIAYGGMAAIPMRSHQAEQVLLGKPWDEQSLELACGAIADDFTPLSDLRASSAYRMQLAQNLMRRFYLETAADMQDQPLKLLDLAEVSA
ncbi:MAG: xanthine dehydrogenase small subunit [Gammaproteobacteria bacterium]|nr:xanthine dehydrogenase small subunit [Gammaproteobacteria bacterium]